MIFKINKEYSKPTKASRNDVKKQHNQKKFALGENPATFIRQTVDNFSSNHPTTEDVKALPFGLDVNIPTGENHNKLFTEFEKFYQNILMIYDTMIQLH